MDTAALRARVEAHIRRHRLIEPAGAVTCLVSGGADSTCLWHALGALGYRVDAVHVNHRLRGDESDEDARFCRERFGAEVVDAPGGSTEAELRDLRYAVASDRLRATGHTASDQVETILYRLAASGRPTGIRPRRDDGVVRPLLTVWREETEAYCRAEGLPFRLDASNPETKRGLIRGQILPLLRQLHPAADENILRALDERETLPPASPRCSPPHPAPGARTSAAASPPCGSTTGSGSSGPRYGSTARSAGASGASSPASQALSLGGGARATGSRAAPKRSRTCSSTRRSPARTARHGLWSSEVTRSWPSPASSRRTG